RVTVVDVSDPDVLALLDELEAETGYREGAFIACNRWHDKFRETEDKLECAERRIAELEAREVTLPQRLQPGADGYDDWYVHSADDGEYLKADDVIAAIRAAGIKVKGE
ncbi:ead/Ea22-like family protein, partial [Salmonella enterica]